MPFCNKNVLLVKCRNLDKCLQKAHIVFIAWILGDVVDLQEEGPEGKSLGH